MGWWNRLLRWITAANQEQYGQGVPNCCQREGKDPPVTKGKEAGAGQRPGRM